MSSFHTNSRGFDDGTERIRLAAAMQMPVCMQQPNVNESDIGRLWTRRNFIEECAGTAEQRTQQIDRTKGALPTPFEAPFFLARRPCHISSRKLSGDNISEAYIRVKEACFEHAGGAE